MSQLSSNTLTVGKIVFARLRFVAIFIIAALVVGYWDNIKNHVDRWTRPGVAPDPLAHAHEGDIEHYCPMHPEVVRSQPGSCPKCGMPLVKRKRGEIQQLPADVLARVTLTPKRKALAGIATSAVEFRPLIREIQSVAVLDYDETRVAKISARVAGRADELFVAFTGQAVKRGDPVYSLYSPEVYTAQRDYLRARKQVNDLSHDASEQARNDATAFYNATLQKLALWGVSHEQLDRLDEEFDRTGKVANNLTVTSPISGIVIKKNISQGDYIQVGAEPYTVADLGKLWLQLKLYEHDIPLVQIGDAAEVHVEAFPGDVFTGSVTFKSFAINPETRTLDARVEVDNPGLKLRPGMFADAVVKIPVAAPARANGPTTLPATKPPSLSAAYRDALQPYLAAHKKLSEDKADGVPDLLAQSAAKLALAKDVPVVAANLPRLDAAVKAMQGKNLEQIRVSFTEVSAAMIEIGKSAGTPADAPTVKVFRCPMKKANWLAEGDATVNPYYGSKMYDCGSAVESLPKALPQAAPARPTTAPVAGRVLAIPRTAVIDTGRSRIVYLESTPGIYDMKAVKVGPLAVADGQEWYPVLEGLEEGDRVVTVGNFLIDAENRLNPTRIQPAAAGGNP